jgi:hypothetical protein
VRLQQFHFIMRPPDVSRLLVRDLQVVSFVSNSYVWATDLFGEVGVGHRAEQRKLLFAPSSRRHESNGSEFALRHQEEVLL